MKDDNKTYQVHSSIISSNLSANLGTNWVTEQNNTLLNARQTDLVLQSRK